MSPKKAPIYQSKVILNETHSPIWRRFLVSSNDTLAKLHNPLQIGMGWQDYHFHMFTIAGKVYGDPEHDEFGELGYLDGRDYRLRKLVTRLGERFQYEYDFGDSWRHTLRQEKIQPPDPKQCLPECLEGQRACPTEDVGGVWGYKTFLEALRDPDHEEHKEYLTWKGSTAPFPLEEIIAGKVFRVRSEDEIWALYFAHGLAMVSGLIAGGPSRRWRIAPEGENFLAAETAVQVERLFHI